MPPPNASGGFALWSRYICYPRFSSRYKRMLGYSALYLPGTDHAGFETSGLRKRI